MLHDWVKSDAAPNGMRNNPMLLNSGTICRLYSRIYSNRNQSFFDVLNRFGDFGPFLVGLSIMSLVIYFCTSSDSGSLVVDIMASNGKVDASALQRVFWAFTEGALATGLIKASETDEGLFSDEGNKAFRAGSICCGLPFTVIICLLIISLQRALEEDAAKAEGKPNPAGTPWTMKLFGGILNIFEVIFSFGTCGPSMYPTAQDFMLWAMAVFVPFVPIFQVAKKLFPASGQLWWVIFQTVVGSGCYYVWIGLLAAQREVSYAWAMGWVFFVGFASVITMLRMDTRLKSNIRGNILEDFFAALFFYWQALPQMVVQPVGPGPSKDNDDYSDPVYKADLEKRLEEY
jgi:hypothetical protein